MKLYNTLTRKVHDIKPIAAPTVSVYTCGPTVYDHAHIGHWFTYIRMDLLIRTLKADGLKPKWVMNITDVGHLTSDADEGEDKLEKGAKREGKTAWEVAEYYTKEFVSSMKQLNIQDPEVMPKATDHIPEQIALIKVLEAKGFTYKIDDGIYYDSSKFPRYAEFARLDLDQQQPGARVAVNKDKRSPTDFALWKFSLEGSKRDMEWDSPWGKGFPGWHIECSAMCLKYLGQTIDIHCGGIDHIPVHHTNEIAQSEAATNKQLARHWMHSNHITVNGQKISKSLSNGITIEDVIAKGYSTEIFRLHVLESHYRSQSKFSWDSLEAAKQRLSDLQSMADLKYQAKSSAGDFQTFALLDVYEELKNLMNDDLNTPAALAYLSDVTAQLLTVGIKPNELGYFNKMLESIDQILGLKLSKLADIDDDAKKLISRREELRAQKKWDESDQIRRKLQDQGIELEDKSTGPQWRRRDVR